MKKYVIKTYDDGIFYGYVAKHPDNEEYSFYDNNIKNALIFDDIDEAEQKAIDTLNGSTLDFIIVQPEENKKYMVIAGYANNKNNNVEIVDFDLTLDEAIETAKETQKDKNVDSVCICQHTDFTYNF